MLINQLLLKPDEALEKYIKSKTQDDIERITHKYQLFEDWVNCQTYIPKNYEKSLLNFFLHNCKYNLDEAKRKFPKFLYYRQTMPELFDLPKFTDDEQKVSDNLIFLTMPTMTEDGYRVTLLSVKNPEFVLSDVSIFYKVMWAIATLKMCRDNIYLGDIFIMDACNFTMGHIPSVLHEAVRKTLFVAYQAIPFRIKAVYIVNAPHYITKAVNLVHPFLKEKLRNRIYIDSGIDVLKNISSRSLPKEFGGTDLNIEELNNLWKKCLEEERDWYEGLKNVRLTGDIPQKLEESCFSDDLLGVQGSFRQLKID